MKITALLTSAGINVALCGVLLSLYSILRKQPSNFSVYFARRLTQAGPVPDDPNFFYRFVPSPSWLLKAWETTENEILEIAGVNAVVFLRLIVFSLRIFSISALASILLVLPFNYYGQEMQHKKIQSESLAVFTIENVKEGSRWLWGHCVALYIITISACVLLYFEYKTITSIRLKHLRTSPPNPSHFAVLVCSIPRRMQGMSCKAAQRCTQNVMPCGFCRVSPNDFRILSREQSSNRVVRPHSDLVLALAARGELPPYHDLAMAARGEEVATAFVFFKTRFAASVAAEVLQSSNPMLWVTDSAPEPHDVYWSNLSIPYRQLWIRKIANLVAAIVFMFLFVIPVTFVQGLTQLERLLNTFPFLKGLFEKRFMSQLITGYLPSVIIMLFLYTVPPTMMLLSTFEGYTSRSGRKRSACRKVLVFMIWNVFFVNVLSGSVISQLNMFNSPKETPTRLARAVPAQASFFTTYVLTSGWASLSTELMQPFALIWNAVRVYIFQKKDAVAAAAASALSFPYHTEVPRVLLFGFLGFNFPILAPLILPFLLGYFFYALLVYRNQFVNVYVPRYESGGQLWPTAHNTAIVSLVLTQIIALAVFGIKESPVASGFTIPLIAGTILFNEYSRQRFHPVFKNNAAEILIELDQQDEASGRLEEIHDELKSVYCQYKLTSHKLCNSAHCDCKSTNHFPRISSNFGPPHKEAVSIEDPVEKCAGPKWFSGGTATTTTTTSATASTTATTTVTASAMAATTANATTTGRATEGCSHNSNSNCNHNRNSKSNKKTDNNKREMVVLFMSKATRKHVFSNCINSKAQSRFKRQGSEPVLTSLLRTDSSSS